MDDLRRLFDELVRRGARVPGPGYQLEWDEDVLRLVGPTPAAFDNGVLYYRLSAANADAVIARQQAFYRGLGRAFEWKTYEHDEPADLPARLAAHGFAAEDLETVMVLDLAGALPPPTAPGITIKRLLDPNDLSDYQRVNDEVHGGDGTPFVAAIAAELRASPETVAVYAAYDGDKPVSSARLTARPGDVFASLWGGGTLQTYRGRGIYRALVGERAAEAKRRGARYLTIDALPTSRPIVERLGFKRLTTTTPYIWSGL